MDWDAIRNLIHRILPPLICELEHCLDERALFSLQNEALFSSFLHPIGSTMMHNILRLLFYQFQSRQSLLYYLANPKIRLPKLFPLMVAFLVASDEVHLVEPIFLTVLDSGVCNGYVSTH